jgi:hypothetical protein
MPIRAAAGPSTPHFGQGLHRRDRGFRRGAEVISEILQVGQTAADLLQPPVGDHAKAVGVADHHATPEARSLGCNRRCGRSARPQVRPLSCRWMSIPEPNSLGHGKDQPQLAIRGRRRCLQGQARPTVFNTHVHRLAHEVSRAPGDTKAPVCGKATKLQVDPVAPRFPQFQHRGDMLDPDVGGPRRYDCGSRSCHRPASVSSNPPGRARKSAWSGAASTPDVRCR